jgi:hypothetical protein
MSCNDPASGLGWPLADADHVRQHADPAGISAAVRLAVPPPGPQHPRQVPAQPAQFRPVNRLVDL